MLGKLAWLGAAVLGLALVGGWWATRGGQAGWEAQIAGWRHPEGLPDLPLLDENKQPFGLGSFADRWVLVGFVYTRCGKAEACPLTMAQMRAVQAAWSPDLPPLELLTLTLDPEYDTPERLVDYAERFGRDPDSPVHWTLATGDPQLMSDGLPALFNILVLPEDGALTHTVKLALLRPGLVLDREWDGVVSAEEILARLR